MGQDYESYINKPSTIKVIYVQRIDKHNQKILS
jgi:hypothetical protein